MQGPIKQALVTGASSGIGAATTVALARDGYVVHMAGRDVARLRSVASSLPGSGHEVHCGDLTADADRAELVSSVGVVDAVVHAAGIHTFTAPRSTARLDEVFAVNTIAPIRLTAELLSAGAIREGKGAIVLLSSVAALVGDPMTAVYAASKAALLGYTRALAADLAPKGIRVVCIAAGLVSTPMGERIMRKLPPDAATDLVRAHPLGIGAGSDVADLIAFACSGRARWITGSVIVIDGGYSVGR